MNSLDSRERLPLQVRRLERLPNTNCFATSVLVAKYKLFCDFVLKGRG
jgi:hypothetical protein